MRPRGKEFSSLDTRVVLGGRHADGRRQHDCRHQEVWPAPLAFLIVPLVGAFFIDIANAVIIKFFIRWLT